MSDRLNLIDTIAKQDKFSTFAKLMASSGADDIFRGAGEFTAFVPTNEAFAKFPEARLTELLNQPDQTKLKSLLSYHIVSGKLMSAHLASAPARNSLTGGELTFSDANGLKVNGASVLSRNIEATNGVVHAVDTVLQPSSTPTALAAAAGTASTPTAAGSSVPPTDAPATADIKSIL
jgi:uncharacterized surface protein with fasciclin (FAS1) repeats